MGDRRGLAEVLNYEAQIAVEAGATDAALDLARQSNAIYEELGDSAGRAFGLARLGLMQGWAGLYREAQPTLTASRALYDELGDQPNAATDDNRLAWSVAALGDLDTAWALARRSIDRFREILGSDEPQALLGGGAIALLRGELSDAARLLQASVTLYEELGMIAHVGRPRAWLATAHWLLGRQADAQIEVLTLLRVTASHPDAFALIHMLLSIALIFAEQGAPERALELYSLAKRHPMVGNNQAVTTFFGQRLDAAAAALSPEEAQSAQARGRERDPWATAHELLAEFKAAGWGGDC